MTWVEASGKTLEEAKKAAARELGVSVDQLQVEVLEEGARGFLGITQPRVRIRAAVLGTEPEPVEVESVVQPEIVARVIPPSKAEQTIRMLEDVLAAMEFDARPELISETDEEIQVNITGSSDDVGRLIGRHGQTLDALQYLLAIAVNRGDPHKVRILLDAEGYRDRHRQMIEAKARDYARQVKATGREAVLEPQSARDRRIVHMALADDPDIYTYSEGEGDDRHVVISPRR